MELDQEITFHTQSTTSVIQAWLSLEVRIEPVLPQEPGVELSPCVCVSILFNIYKPVQPQEPGVELSRCVCVCILFNIY